MTARTLSTGPAVRIWSGQWVTDHLGVTIRTDDAPGGLTLPDLVGMALRVNPRRAHLLVSTVLGKHIPTDPRIVYGAGLLLGARVSDRLRGHDSDIGRAGGRLLHAALNGSLSAAGELAAWGDQHRAASAHDLQADDICVLGYAETATGLGHCVADALGARYLHSTRRAVPGVTDVGGFEEEHSHATSHLLLPERSDFLAGTGPLVLVDDELSTGQTVLNTIAALHPRHPRQHYVIAALIDLRTPFDRARMAAAAEDWGTRIDVVTLAAGHLDLPADVLERGARLVADRRAVRTVRPAVPTDRRIERPPVSWPPGMRDGGRHGFTSEHRMDVDLAVGTAAQALLEELRVDVSERAAPTSADQTRPRSRVLVLGTEELMYLPMRIAARLADLSETHATVDGPPLDVVFSTTTRSPALPIDEPGYAIRTALTFEPDDQPSDGSADRFAYNVDVAAAAATAFDQIVLITDAAEDTAGVRSLLAALDRCARRVLLLVVPSYRPNPAPAQQPVTAPLPVPLRGPDFGSYRRDEVTWLLTDLSHVALEAPVEEREEAIQLGGAHYAESLPIEYQPSAAYQELFTEALQESADTVAHAVGIVTELVLAERGHGAVLVSLARAGTPIGILMRRWAQFAHGLDVAHYAASIVRGKGLDAVALDYLAAHHNPADVVFVDGWTGKGAITRELADAVISANGRLGLAADRAFDPQMAVLADTGHCVRLFGTRADFLIPSACLNSTVSGLVSRTVLNDALIGPGQFHGAKFYRDLIGVDVSGQFLDVVSARFAAVAGSVAVDLPGAAAADREPTWSGWKTVEALSAAYGINDVNLVKPGVGETTRVLLRRVPWKVLIRADAEDLLPHVRLLAEQRGVPVELVQDMTYSCVGLIHPKFTQAATGRLGVAVSS